MPLEKPLVILEGALLTAGRPLTVREMRLLFSNAYSRSDILKWLEEIQQKWSGLAVHLTEVAGGWRFSGSSELEPYLRRLTTEKPPRYSRSFLETLAIIAYKQPVTRGDIEDIRGVTVNSNIMKQLQDRDWIECVGHRDTPGRPALWATTAKFLEDFTLESLRALPVVPESTEVQPRLPGFEDLSKNGAGADSAAEANPEPVRESEPVASDEPLETEEQKNDES